MSGVDNPDEIDRASSALAGLERKLGEDEGAIRRTMNTLQLRSTDPGGRMRNEVVEAARLVNQARIKLEAASKAMRRVAQELRNTRI